ncbi:MAG: hypothetical protein ACQER7_03760 [Bacteroidota bacterium]
MEEQTKINHNFNNKLFEENKRINREIRREKIYARLTLLAIVLFIAMIVTLITWL